MKARKALDIIMSIGVAMLLMAGGFARFHHHTPDHRACFCLTLSDASAHALAHSHEHDKGGCCHHENGSGSDCCGFTIDDFQIVHDNDDDSDDCYTTLPIAILPCAASALHSDDFRVATVSRRNLSLHISEPDGCPAGLRAPPVV